MAPVRRYLRISKYSVLECRIYLDNPALVQSWLLNPRNPILPRVIESVRPLVLPKLREERERSKKKGSKKKAIKDTVTQDDFEVSIFLTETDTRHSLLAKHKYFRDKLPPRMQSNTNKLTGETSEDPLHIDGDGDVTIPREESDDEDNVLAQIPVAPGARSTRQKRHRNVDDDDYDEFEVSDGDYEAPGPIDVDSDSEQPASKRPRESTRVVGQDEDVEEEKKKMAMDVSYEGFAIYGRVLCLVVRRTDNHRGGVKANANSGAAPVKPSGQANMANWITSTQIPLGEDIR